jgi:hypothetical protein
MLFAGAPQRLDHPGPIFPSFAKQLACHFGRSSTARMKNARNAGGGDRTKSGLPAAAAQRLGNYSVRKREEADMPNEPAKQTPA